MKKILLTVALLAVAIAGQACTNFIVGIGMNDTLN